MLNDCLKDSGVAFSPPLRNSSPNSLTPQDTNKTKRKILYLTEAIRDNESNSIKERVPHQRITSMLPVITSPWFLLSLHAVAFTPEILNDGLAPVEKLVGVE